MEETTTRPLLDTLIESRELQILKTVIPYMQESQQKNMAILIKFMELQKTAALFDAPDDDASQELHACAGESDTERLSKMLQAIRGFFSEKEAENIDMILNFLDMSTGYDMMFHS